MTVPKRRGRQMLVSPGERQPVFKSTRRGERRDLEMPVDGRERMFVNADRVQ